MKLRELIDPVLLDEMIAKRYVNVQELPGYCYKIYNYSKMCTIDHVWNDVTETCRGIITDKDDNIIARPFRKFYNFEEIEHKNIIPDLPFKIYDKRDGSLGILYWTEEGIPMIATRGSFISDQANFATNLLRKILRGKKTELGLMDFNSDLMSFVTMNRLQNGFELKNVRYTLLFEIIYPGDRHVVNYGKEEDITLLAIIDNETGGEIDPHILSPIFNVVKEYDVKDWKTIRDKYDGDNAEGFVVKFENNFRMKLKYEQWFRKNALMVGLSRRKVLEFIVNDDLKGLYGIVNQLNEENKIYYTNIVKELRSMYTDMECEALQEYKEFDTDKEAAFYFNTCKHRAILFAMRKNKDYSRIIWQKIKEMVKETNDNNEDSE